MLYVQVRYIDGKKKQRRERPTHASRKETVEQHEYHQAAAVPLQLVDSVTVRTHAFKPAAKQPAGRWCCFASGWC